MSYFEIWLDESGNFSDETVNESKVPSLVGGVIIKGEKFTEDIAKEILGTKKGIHAAEMDYKSLADLVNHTLDKLKQYKILPVVFENRERVSIVDPQTTYLSVFAEGIMQLINDLSLGENKPVFNLHIARRMYRKDNLLTQMKNEEYISRLEERISLVKLKNPSLSKVNNFVVNIEIGAASEDRRLMVSDVICHAWFSKGYKFPNDLQEKIVSSLEGKTYSIIEPGGIASIKQRIKEKSFGIGLCEWIGNFYELVNSKNNTRENIKKITNLKENLCYEIGQLNRSEKNMQLSILTNYIKALVNYTKQYNLAMSYFIIFFNEIVPRLKSIKVETNRIEAEVHFSCLTSALNLGNVLMVEEEIKKIESLIQGLAKRWENLEFISEYYIRKGSYLYSVYENDASITLMDKLEEMVSGIAEISASILSDEFKTGEGTVNSTLLGKIFGVRSQAYLKKSIENDTFLTLAEKDCELALNQFESHSDKARQYQTLAQIYRIREDFNSAEELLSKSLSLPADASYENIILEIYNQPNHLKLFSLMHYLNVLSQAFLKGENEFATQRFNYLKRNFDLNDLEELNYPYNVVLSHFATCQIFNKEASSGMKKFEKAISLSLQDGEKVLMYISGLNQIATLLIALEKNNLLTEKNYIKYFGLAQRSIKKLYAEFHNLPLSIQDKVEKWKNCLDTNNSYKSFNSNLFLKYINEN